MNYSETRENFERRLTMKTEHKPREIKKFLNDLIGANQVDEDTIEFEYLVSPANAYVKIKEFFEMDKKG